MVAVRNRIGPNSRIIIFTDGEQFEVPLAELDREDLEQLADTATAMLIDRLVTRVR